MWWQRSLGRQRTTHGIRRPMAFGKRGRHLCVEPLEQRRLLALVDLVIDANDTGGNGIDNGAPDEFRIVLDTAGASLEVYLDGNFSTSAPFANVNTITVNGSGDDDTLIVDLTNGVPVPANGVTFTALGQTAGGGDSLEVIGTSTSVVDYSPSATTTGDGQVTIDGRVVAFTGLEPVTVNGAASLTLTTPNNRNEITIENPAAGTTLVTGDSDAVPFESLTFLNVSDFTVDCATNGFDDGFFLRDRVYIHAALNGLGGVGLGGQALTNVTVKTGTGDDDLWVELPYNLGPGGVLRWEAGGTVAFPPPDFDFGVDQDFLEVDYLPGDVSSTTEIRDGVVDVIGELEIQFDTTQFGSGDLIVLGTGDGDDDTTVLLSAVNLVPDVLVDGEGGADDVTVVGVPNANDEPDFFTYFDDDAVLVDMFVGAGGTGYQATWFQHVHGTIAFVGQDSLGDTEVLRVEGRSDYAHVATIRPDAAFDGVVEDVGFPSLFFDDVTEVSMETGDVEDDITVVPLPIPVKVVGGTPTLGVDPGADALTVDVSGIAVTTLENTVTGPGEGVVQVNSLGPITYESIEDVGFSIDADAGGSGNAGDGNPDSFIIQLDPTGTNVEVLVGPPGSESLVYSGPLSDVGALIVNGSSDDDTLTVDSEQELVETMIQYNGGDGADRLELVGDPGPGFEETYSVGPADDEGVIVTSDGVATQTITFTGLEPIIDTVVAPSLTINATDEANNIRVENGTAGRVRVTVDAFEYIEFSNKTNLIINALGGADVVELDFNNSASGLQTVTVNGAEGDDEIRVRAVAAGLTSVALNGQGGDDWLIVGNAAGSLDGVMAPVEVTGGETGETFGDLLKVLDYAGTAEPLGTLTDTTISGVGPADVTYGELEDLWLDTVDAQPTTLDVLSTAADAATYLELTSGNVAATVTVGNETAGFGDGTGDQDTILGLVLVQNSGGQITLQVDDTGDATADVAAVEQVGPHTVIRGLGPASVRYDTVAVDDLIVLAGSGGNTIDVNDTTATGSTRIDSGTGSDSSTVTINADGLTAANTFAGNTGNDRFVLNVTNNVAGTSLAIEGNDPAGDPANRDVLEINDLGGGVRTLSFDYPTPVSGDLDISGFAIAVNVRSIETVDYIGDATDDDLVTVTATADADAIEVTPTGPASADLILAGGVGVALGPDLSLDGLDGNDGLVIDGSTPAFPGAPGNQDVLFYNDPGPAGLLVLGPGAGVISSLAPGLLDVEFIEIEDVLSINPLLTIVTADADPGPNEADNGAADDFLVQLDAATATQLEVFVNGTLVFDSPVTDVIGLIIGGSSDDDILTVNNANGLVVLPDGISLDGEFLGANAGSGDLLIVEGDPGTVIQRETYATGPLVPPPLGPLAADGGLLVLDPDDVIAAAVLDGNEQLIVFSGLSPVLDSTPAVQLDVFTPSASDTVSVVDGSAIPGSTSTQINDSGSSTFESTEFANKTVVSINLLDGADRVRVDNLNTADGLTTLELYGNELTGGLVNTDDDASDRFDVEAIGAAVDVQAFGQGGNDVFDLENGFDVDEILGDVVVSGGPGDDDLIVDDAGSALVNGPETVTVTETTIDGITGPGGGGGLITYATLNAGTVMISSNAAGHAYDVQSTAAGLTETELNTGGGVDTITINDGAGTANDVVSPIDLNAQGGNNDLLRIEDAADAAANTFHMNATEIGGGAFGAAVSPGGIFGAGGILTYNGDLERLLVYGPDGPGADNTYNVDATGVGLTDLVGFVDVEDGQGSAVFNIQGDQLAAPAVHIFGGHDGTDTFNVHLAASAVVTGNSVTIFGDDPDGATGTRDAVNVVDGGGARTTTVIYQSPMGQALVDVDGGTPLDVHFVETLTAPGDGGNDDTVTVVGSIGDDDLTVVPTDANSALVFLGGDPWDGPPEGDSLDQYPGAAGGAMGPDLNLGDVVATGILIDGGLGTSNTVYVHAPSEDNLVHAPTQAALVDPFGVGNGVIIPSAAAMGLPDAFDAIGMSDAAVAITNTGGALLPVNLATGSFVQADRDAPGLIVNAGFEAAPPDSGVADNVMAELSFNFALQVNGGDPAPAFAPEGDRLHVETPGEVNVYSNKTDPPEVTITSSDPLSGEPTFGLTWSSIESVVLTPGSSSQTVNLLGDNNDPGVDQNDNYVLVGADVDSLLPPIPDAQPEFQPDADGDNEFFLEINGSAPIGFRNVTTLNAFGDDQNPPPGAASRGPDHADRLEVTPYADDTPQGWGIDVSFDGGNPSADATDTPDLLVYNSVAGVAEGIIVAPSGPEAGQLIVNNAATGTPIVVMDYTTNTGIEINGNDGSAGDTDTLILRGSDGGDNVSADLTADGGAADPFVSVTDAGSADVLYELIDFSNFDALSFELGAGNDTMHVTPGGIPVFVDGGGPVGRLQGPGDALNVLTGGAPFEINQGPESDSGNFLVAGSQPVSFDQIESLLVDGEQIVLPDPLEPNDSIADATTLGSEPSVTVIGLSLHDQVTGTVNQDFFQITAHDTGKLVVNASFTDALGDINIEIQDVTGRVVDGSATETDNEQITIPVVFQERYYLRVFSADNDSNVYDLEIENFAAPVPNAVVLDPADDTGRSNRDEVTSPALVVPADQLALTIEADLTEFDAEGVPMLDAAAVANGAAGAAVRVFVNSTPVGYAEPVDGTNFDLWSFTLDTTAAPISSTDGLYLVKAAVTIFDGQSGQAQASGRTTLSLPLELTLDATAPATPAALDLLTSSDSFDDVQGLLGPQWSNTDNVTNKMQPAFTGTGEPNAMVRLYAALKDPVTHIDVGPPELVGQSVVNTDGTWEITVEPLIDGHYNVYAESEDLAGNVSGGLADRGVFVNTDSVAIPDTTLGSTTSTITVSAATVGDGARVDNVDLLGYPVSHPDLGQVDVTLTSPDGTTLDVDPSLGVVFPGFGGENAVGDWTLTAYDIRGDNVVGEVLPWEFILVTNTGFDGPVGPGPGVDIPDATAGTVSSTTTVTGLAGEITAVTVSPSISSNSSSYKSYLVVTLTSPSGTTVDVGPSGGTFNGFDGERAQGDWTLTVVDTLEGRIGTLDGWSLDVETVGATVNVQIDTLAPQRPTLDLLAADDSGSSDLDDVTNRANDVPFTVTAEPGSRVLIKNGETVIDDFVIAGTSTVRTLTLAEGTHLLSAEAFDQAGNRSVQTEVLALTIDRTAPATPGAPDLLESSDTFDNVAGLIGPQWTKTDNVTAINQPAFDGVAEANGLVRVLANGVVVGEGIVASGGAWEVTVEPLADGNYNVTVEIEDLAGNVSQPSAPLAIVVDTLAPERPTLDLLAADDSGSSDLDNVTNRANDVPITVTAEPGSRVLIKDGEVVIDDFVIAGTSTTRWLTLAEGEHQLSAEAFDQPGNRSAQSEVLALTIDRTAPARPGVPDLLESSDTFDNVPGLAGPRWTNFDDVTAINQPAFSGEAEANALVGIFATDTVTGTSQLVGQGVVNSDVTNGVDGDGLGIWEVTVEPLADGNYDVTVVLEDLAGNGSEFSAALNVTIDTRAPQRPTLDLLAADDSGSSDLDNVTNRANDVPITVTAEDGSRVLIKNGEMVIDDFVMPGPSTVRTLTLAEGEHPLSAEAFDQPGNRSAQSEVLDLTIDRTAPADAGITIDLALTSDTGVVGDNITAIQRPAFLGRAEANALIRVVANGTLVGRGVVGSDESDGEGTDGLGVWEVTVEPLAYNDYVITVEVEDLAGNVTGATDQEWILVDPFEPNDSVAEAYVLGSEPVITLNGVVLHDADDEDFFRITAHDTGKLVINALFSHAAGDVNIFVVDSGGNFIAGSASIDDNEKIVIPVVAQEQYFLQVVLDDGLENGFETLYDLEIENFAAPVPRAPVLDPNDDSGMLNSDLVTFVDDARIFIVADLDEFASEGVPILSAAAAKGGVTGVRVGFADPFGASANLFQFQFDPSDPDGDFDDNVPIGPDAGLIAPDALGYFNIITAAVRIFDGQGDEGEPTPAEGRSPLSDSLDVQFDPNVPDASLATMAMATYSETGDVGDATTAINQPALVGVAEANTRLRLYAQRFDEAGQPIGVPDLVGQTVVGSDTSDVGAAGDGADYVEIDEELRAGAPDDGIGLWEITLEPLADGDYRITMEIEDVAGNSSDQDDGPSLDLTIDTREPQRPTIDLVNADDTGMSDLDNVTIGDPDVLPQTQVADFRISAEPESTVNVKDGNTIIDTFVFDAAFDATDGVPGDGFGIRRIDFAANETTFGIPAEGPHPLSVEALDEADNRSHQSEELLVTIDTTPPAPSQPNLLPDSDSGRFNDDDVTNVSAPAFFGWAEANAKIRVYADGQLVGQGIVNSDESDGDPNDGLGTWEVTVEPLDDGVYNVTTVVEDLAGNLSSNEGLDPLVIEIDTLAPNTPYLDLREADDSGRHNDDNVTNVVDPWFSATTDDPNAAAHLIAENLQFRIFDRPEFGPEVLLFDSGVGGLISQTQVLTQLGPLADGIHDLKLEVEDRAGNISADFLLDVLVDTIAPPVSILGLDAPGDTGVIGDQATFVDRVTSDTAAGFVGRAEADAIVRLYADVTANGLIDLPGEFSLTVAVPLDGDEAFPDGQWQTAFIRDLNDPIDPDPPVFPLDGFREILVTAEDLAGNVNTVDGVEDTDQVLDIFIDTQGPRVEQVTIPGDPEYNLFSPKPDTDGPTPLVDSLAILVSDLPARSDLDPNFLYAALHEPTALNPGHYRLVGDHNGVVPIESVLVDQPGRDDGAPATATITLVFADPLPDDRFTLTLSDSLVDPVGNALDGETDRVEPLDAPQLASGDGVPGGDFVARFTVDSRPEIGVWSAGSIYVDTNGNFTFDPQNPDHVNRDITYTMGFASDDIFAGNFSGMNANVDGNVGSMIDQGDYVVYVPGDLPTEPADGFDKLAAYGMNMDGVRRWLVDVNNDGVADIDQPEPSPLPSGFSGLGAPVAGNFDVEGADNGEDPGRLNGDEVGLFDGTNWWLDTDRDFNVSDETPLNPGLKGYPIVGDFDGDGYDDLATFLNGVFTFDLFANGGLGMEPSPMPTVELEFLQFIGIRERPVAADMNQDGIDDLGLWVPDRSGATPEEGGEWYFLISDDSLQEDGSLAPLDHDYTPIPFGDDFFAQFGDEYAAPIVGNFDPPVAKVSGESPDLLAEVYLQEADTPLPDDPQGEADTVSSNLEWVDEWTPF
ncbi:MAG: Ig-like domain-containing protein, partial [Planctomycetota bacterium]